MVERSVGPDGKGELLKWHLSDNPLAGNEVLVVMDADNRVEADFLSLLSEAVADGHQVVQASVLPSNLDASPIAAAAGWGLDGEGDGLQEGGWAGMAGGTGRNGVLHQRRSIVRCWGMERFVHRRS